MQELSARRNRGAVQPPAGGDPSLRERKRPLVADHGGFVAGAARRAAFHLGRGEPGCRR